MMKEDLGLTLSLSFSPPVDNHRPDPLLQLNLMPSWTNKTQTQIMTFPASLDHHHRSSDTGSFFKGIDVNHSPATVVDCEEEPVVSSPNSTISSVMSGGKRTSSDLLAEENDAERGISDEEDGDGSRKKLRLSKDQSATLEESFKEHNTLNPKQKQALAKRLGLRPRQVEVWFQNRRARTKLKQTEVDCEFLKRCCDNLTEENRRLQKEVQELRALKLTPQFYMQMAPPTTLTLCPSCERVGPATTPSSAAVDPRSINRANVPFNHHPWAAVPQRQFM
ncbi:homeobox-leucine zipper protein HAT3-like [Impatiens glandulifera]|uniref:homeobox-leucine zipper protein HAT3-like n=1 Tax=Impatiens glandulifera TaxID=253017 RepID=UPI001FB0672A|nr:homeobox-leucine zipper protein HAT3-like [Impatiens glandulifera]